jgi:hypothetical protein
MNVFNILKLSPIAVVLDFTVRNREENLGSRENHLVRVHLVANARILLCRVFSFIPPMNSRTTKLPCGDSCTFFEEPEED